MRQARDLQDHLARELLGARLSAGVSQDHVARIARLSQSRVSRTERLEQPWPRIDELAAHCAALGLRLVVKLYPEGSPVRDAGHLCLLERLRATIHAVYSWKSEVPVAGPGDQRAWDAMLAGPARVAVDAETRLHDLQDVQRRVELEWRDSGLSFVVLPVAASHHDRRVLREHRVALASTFPPDPESDPDGWAIRSEDVVDPCRRQATYEPAPTMGGTGARRAGSPMWPQRLPWPR